MRTKATIYSFFIVFVLYFVYGWTLVPLVLPNPDNDSKLPIDIVQDTTREEIGPILELLPEDGWERDTQEEIHLLQFGQTVVLFGTDKIEGTTIRLEPCTILLLPDDKQEYLDEEDAKNRIRQSVVLRTPQYAEIEFDKDFDISKMPLPKIVTGRLFGKVTIQSDMNDPGKHDDLYLETEGIEITETSGSTKIEALRDVRFTMGFHNGVGSGLTLETVQSDLNQSQVNREFSHATFRSLKSLRLVFPESPNIKPKLSGGLYVPDGPATTIDIHCRGRFRFVTNPAEQGWTASFDQDVSMVRNNPDNTVDRLTAEEVHLTLKPVDQNGSTVIGNKASQFGNIEPALFVAHGKAGQNGQPPIPARLSVKQSSDITLVGDEIFLDLRKNSLSLSTRKTAGASPFVEMILADQYKIRSEHCVQYTLGQNGSFGKFDSEGKGDMNGRLGEGAAAKDISLTWNKMQMEPHPLVKDQVILKLSKGISARMTGFGTMKADELELYCNFVSSNSSATKLPSMGNQKSNLTLDQAIVKDKDNVLFETSSGTCKVKQLNIFFTNVTADGNVLHSRWTPQILTEKPPAVPRTVFSQQPIQQPIRQVQHLEPLQPQKMQPLPLYQPPAVTVATPVYGNRIPNGQSSPTPMGFVETQNLLGIKSSPNGGKFEMTGDLMRMQVRVQNGQSSAEIVAIEGNVRLKENVPNNVPNTAIEISGNTVTIWNPADPTTQINIKGQPTGNDAIFKGKGVELCAQELNLSRLDNTFWSPGAGRLIANTAQINTSGMQTGNSSDNKLIVEWNKEMRCDGKVIIFSGLPDRDGSRVRTLYQTQSLLCNVMEIRLNRQVLFFDDQSPVEPKAVEIRCANDVIIRNRQLDAQGKQKSIDFAKVENLQYDVEKNYLVAEGPGEMYSIFLGSEQGFNKTSPGNLVGTPANQTSGELKNYLVVGFQDTVQGVLLGNSKMVEIKGRVMAAYCPAASWDDTISLGNFSTARKIGYTLECERLKIAEVPNPVNMSASSMELTASDSAIIEGNGIWGKAQTIMYNQAKSTVKLDGNVSLQTTIQGQPARHDAQTIQYNIETGNIDFIQAQGLGIGQ